MQEWISKLIEIVDTESSEVEYQALSLAVILAAAFVLHFIYNQWVTPWIRRISEATKTRWDDFLLNDKVVSAVGKFVPLLVVKWTMPYSIAHDTLLYVVGMRVIQAVMVLLVVFTISAVLSGINNKIKTHDGAKRPTTAIFQMIKLVCWCIGVLVAVATLFDKDPKVLFTGLGASAAVLMLVFQDTIVGLVSGVQLVAYDMIRKGDWVVMDKNDVNGEVIDVNLNTVKVRNWDNSIVTVPPSVMMKESFHNYRTMQKLKARQVRQQYVIDYRSVVETTPEFVVKLKEQNLYVPLSEVEQRVDDAIETNLQLFGRYLERYISKLVYVNKKYIYMARVRPMTNHGVPLEAYFYLTITGWKQYEHAQQRFAEHVLVTLPKFGLKLYQQPTADDLAALGGGN